MLFNIYDIIFIEQFTQHNVIFIIVGYVGYVEQHIQHTYIQSMASFVLEKDQYMA